jgi:hypothetical protein
MENYFAQQGGIFGELAECIATIYTGKRRTGASNLIAVDSRKGGV